MLQIPLKSLLTWVLLNSKFHFMSPPYLWWFLFLDLKMPKQCTMILVFGSENAKMMPKINLKYDIIRDQRGQGDITDILWWCVFEPFFLVGVRGDIWNLTCDTWHLTCDMWRMTQGGEEHFVRISGSCLYGLGVKVSWRFGTKGWLN